MVLDGDAAAQNKSICSHANCFLGGLCGALCLEAVVQVTSVPGLKYCSVSLSPPHVPRYSSEGTGKACLWAGV